MITDLRLLWASRSLRSFGFGFGAVVLGVYLADRGFSAWMIGLLITATIVAASVLGLGFAALSAQVGRRGALCASGLLMALAGFDLAFAQGPALVALASLTGMLSTGMVDLGPFSAVEQAVLTEATPPSRRNRAFARYSTIGSGAAAVGSLVAALGAAPSGVRALWILYGTVGVATALIPMALPPAVERPVQAPLMSSVRPLMGLIALLALDSLGGGFVVRSAVTYWLHIRFGAGVQILGPAFAAITVLSVLSFELAGLMADRIGLINTMVFPHLPSNLFLLAVPFSATLAVALALLLANGALADMDVPARQAYLVSTVKPAERAGAVALVGAARAGALAVGPVLTGIPIQSAALGLPFLFSGSIKCIYDLALFVGYRQRRAEHELHRISS